MVYISQESWVSEGHNNRIIRTNAVKLSCIGKNNLKIYGGIMPENKIEILTRLRTAPRQPLQGAVGDAPKCGILTNQKRGERRGI